jgi:hypothetical protein
MVLALLRSGRWRVRIMDLRADAALTPDEDDGLLGAALRDGRAVYISANVCELAQLTKGILILSSMHSMKKVAYSSIALLRITLPKVPHRWISVSQEEQFNFDVSWLCIPRAYGLKSKQAMEIS